MRVEAIAGPPKTAAWLRTSLPALAWATPLDLIGQGRVEQVAEVIDALEEPAGG